MSDPKRKKLALGKGLSALLSDSPSNLSQELTTDKTPSVSSVAEISISSIEVNPYQPRIDFDKDSLLELAESIKVQGIIQPITVRKLDHQTYQLIAGERRFQASKLAGLKTIPAYIRIADDQQMLEMALIENIQRVDLNSIEIALSYQRLLTECNLKQEELGERVGKNRSTVTNYLRLLKLPPAIQVAVRDQQISMGHARALINIENIDLQLSIFQKIIKEELSVRKTEALVRELIGGNKTQKTAPKSLPKDFQNLQTNLCSYFGTKVKVKTTENGNGEIAIPFVNHDDLNRILEIINFEF